MAKICIEKCIRGNEVSWSVVEVGSVTRDLRRGLSLDQALDHAIFCCEHYGDVMSAYMTVWCDGRFYGSYNDWSVSLCEADPELVARYLELCADVEL